VVQSGVEVVPAVAGGFPNCDIMRPMSEAYDRLKNQVSRFHSDLAIDDTKVGNPKVLRPNLGEESAQQAIGSALEKTGLYLRMFFMYGEDVSDDVLETVTAATLEMMNVVNQFAGMNNQDYIRNKPQLIAGVDAAWNKIRAVANHAVAAGVLRQKLLEQNLDKKYGEAEKQIGELSNKLGSEFKKELDTKAAAIREYLEKREEELKRTAFKVSVEAAQQQFGEAEAFYKKQVRLWASIAVLTLLGFGAFGWFLLTSARPPATLDVIYFTAIRLVLLSALAAVATFCLRVFRSNLHMRAQNAHRLRVANSIAAFVEAARTNEQSDQILAQLVGAVASFGSTGLVETDDRPIVPIEAISKVLVERVK
jgi:hypothetical protein